MKMARKIIASRHRRDGTCHVGRALWLAGMFAIAFAAGCDRSPKSAASTQPASSQPAPASQPVSTSQPTPAETQQGAAEQTGDHATQQAAAKTPDANADGNDKGGGGKNGSGNGKGGGGTTGGSGNENGSGVANGGDGDGDGAGGGSGGSSGASGQTTGNSSRGRSAARNGTRGRSDTRAGNAAENSGDLDPLDPGTDEGPEADFPAGKGGGGRSTELSKAPTGVQLPQLNPLELPSLPQLPSTVPAAPSGESAMFTQLVGRWNQVDGPMTPDISEGGYTASTLVFSADGSLVIERAFDEQRSVVLIRRFMWQIAKDGRLHIDAVKSKAAAESFNGSIKLPTGSIDPPDTKPPTDQLVTITAKALKLFGKHHVREAK